LTASASQPKAVPVDRRIIERPRLIKLLDETDAHTILLLAPAGYGKTTLARQWAKTLNGAIWVTLSQAHRDVAWLAEDIAGVIDGARPGATRVVREHIKARTNPQRAARELGSVLADRLEAADIRWIILDDYQELSSSSEAEDLIATLDREGGARTLIASRVRPNWASGRRFVYGEIFEITRRELAMTEDEAVTVLGKRPSSAHLSEQAEGWPAVIGLAATVDSAVVPPDSVPEALHRYLAEELFQRASPELRDALLRLALRGRAPDSRRLRNADVEATIAAEAVSLGFSSSVEELDLHPLIQEFLLEKLVALPDIEERARAAVASNAGEGVWEHALALVRRFKLHDLVEPTLSSAFTPLIREGRLATLEGFARVFQSEISPCPPSANVVLAEAAFRDGNLELALDLAEAVASQLSDDHPAASRAAALIGQIGFLNADFASAEMAFRRAQHSSTDERDEAEAMHGLALASIFGEQAGAEKAVAALRAIRNRSPIDFLRFASSETALRLIGMAPDGLSGSLHLEVAREMLPLADDPRARTMLTYTVASALTQRGDYADAREWLNQFFADAESYSLEFATPYAKWTLAQIAMGQRRFGEAERALQAVEDVAARQRERHHELNARALRARLLLQTSEPDAALRCLLPDPDGPLIPSWRAEYLVTRGFALACAGEPRESELSVRAAEKMSHALEVRGLALVARTINSLTSSRRTEQYVSKLFAMATELDLWDPVVCGVRSAPRLGDAIADNNRLRPALEELYRRTGDVALARRAGFRTRATSRPVEILSPREYEILGLIARGMRNRDISRALFIADSTTKVHVRHILEKLGVRTRAEAAARLRMFDDA
jgi:ATP/maltotriose-dependent transcriptional regulator MalT